MPGAAVDRIGDPCPDVQAPNHHAAVAARSAVPPRSPSGVATGQLTAPEATLRPETASV